MNDIASAIPINVAKLAFYLYCEKRRVTFINNKTCKYCSNDESIII
jgi:hypothetical protein